MKVVKQDGYKVRFDEGKLWNSLYYPARECHYEEGRAVDLADEAKSRIMNWVHEHEDDVLTTEEIRDKAIEVLEDIDEDVAFMYSTHLELN